MKKLFIRFLLKLRIAEAFNLTFKTIVNGQSFKIPLIKKIGFEHIHRNEPWMISLLKKILEDKKGKAYVDVGVNLGQTLIKLKSVSPDMKYYGFEPNPVCVFYVRDLIKINQLKNITVFPVGISDKTSIYQLTFFSGDDSDSSASIINNFRPEQKAFCNEYVACFSMSEITEKYDMPSIGILKIDVEGAEKEVIESFSEKIISDQPYIQLEILPVYYAKNIERLVRQEAVENFLKQINYSILRIHTDKSDELLSLEEIETIGIHSNLDWCNYLLVPKNSKDAVKKKFQSN